MVFKLINMANSGSKNIANSGSENMANSGSALYFHLKKRLV